MSSMWTVHRGGVQFGPADEATMRTWMADGRVVATDLVWAEGQPGWQPLASVPLFAGQATGPVGGPVVHAGSLGAFGSAGYVPAHVPAHLVPPPGQVPGPPPPPAYGAPPAYGSPYGYAPVGYAPAAPQRPSTGMAMLLPVGRSGYAIAAGYCALFGLVVFPLAIVGLVLGIVALRDIGRRPHLLGRGRAVFAIVVGSCWALLLAVLVLTRR